MKEFALDLMFRLAVGAASGIHCLGTSIFIVSDNSGYLYRYDTEKKDLEKTALFEGAAEITPKKEKKDFEAMGFHGNNLYIFGSGSKPRRAQGFIFDLAKKKNTPVDLSNLYAELCRISAVGKDLNIEGAAFYRDQLLLFQRGNGTTAINGVFRLDGIGDFPDVKNITFTKIELPTIGGWHASFTDAVVVGNKIYFLAAAENSSSTYLDGEVSGTLIGSMDAETFKVERIVMLGKQKFEGITLLKDAKKEIQFLICEDDDKNTIEGAIYKLTLHK